MHAITLSRRDFREYDQIVSLLTKEGGKLELLARGVKKITSKNSASLEPFSLVIIEVAKGKEIDYLTTANSVAVFKDLRADLTKSVRASYMVSLVDKLIVAGQKEDRVFDLLHSSLNKLLESGYDLFLTVFVLKLMDALGFSPNLKQCSGCGNRSARTYFDIAGGVVCVDCHGKQPGGRTFYKLNDRLLTALETALAPDWEAKVELEQRDQATFNELAYNFACYHAGRKLQDWRSLVF
jgi:DNA repair protein RecO (recombination protein O)